MVALLNGAGDDGGEKAHKQCIPEEVLLRRVLALVLIHGVAQAGKGEVGKAQRRYQLQGRKMDAQQSLTEKVIIFVKEKYSHAGEKRQT